MASPMHRLSLSEAVRKASIKNPEKKKFSIVEFTAQQRSLAERVLGKWHSLVDDAHRQLHQEQEKKAEKEMFQMRHMPKTGVIYATSRAVENGYTEQAEDWANMGQGAPECGELPGQPPRPTSVDFDVFHQEYAPVAGMPELREAVAEHYNHLYRQGKMPYTMENVVIIPGGRGGLSRVMACLGNINVGYGVPDYTAYEELLGNLRSINPVPMSKEDDNIAIDPARLRKQIMQLGLGGVLVSNPCNPTGYLIEGEELEAWVSTARELECLLMMDEFYSHYIYPEDESVQGKTVSSAAYVNDVNADPVLIIDGLTKNWRCPGWRICWIIAPKQMCQSIAAAASYMDGGAAHPLQKAALPLVRDLDWVRQDILALQKHFRMKRDIFLEGILKLGIKIDMVPQGTFYVWADLSGLPHPLNDGITFFEECIKEKLICVPGIFFDINPGKRRHYKHSPYQSYVRFSYGPKVKNIELGLKAIERVINKFKK